MGIVQVHRAMGADGREGSRSELRLGMRETELLSHIARRSADLAGSFPGVVVGPGDDCAVVRVEGEMLLTVDQVVAGRHFEAGTLVELIAQKAVARSVSDIAAMGGTPRWGLATGLLPRGYAQGDALFDAMARWGREFGAPLVGGDVATWDGGLVITCTVGGAVHAKRGAVLRSGARPGDEVWVTGRVGGSLGSGRHLSFVPRVAEGAWLCDVLGDDLHAMIDVSDGVGIDASRIAAASGVGIEIELELVPQHEGVKDALRAIGDGEDYELLFAVKAGAPKASATENGTMLTRIGRVVAGPAGSCVAIDGKGKRFDVAASGWEH